MPVNMTMRFTFKIGNGRLAAGPTGSVLSPARRILRASLSFCLILLVAIWAAALSAQAQTQPGTSQASSPPAVLQTAATKTQSADSSTAEDPPDPSPSDDVPAMFPHFKDTRFWLSGQTNFIFQTHPPFPALYSGTHSLSPNYEKATSRVLTLYTGVRLNNSTELLVDIEEAGGAALVTGLWTGRQYGSGYRAQSALSKAPYLGPRDDSQGFCAQQRQS